MEPTTQEIQEWNDKKNTFCHDKMNILLKRLEAAENAAKDYSQIAANYCVRTEAAEQKLAKAEQHKTDLFDIAHKAEAKLKDIAEFVDNEAGLCVQCLAVQAILEDSDENK